MQADHRAVSYIDETECVHVFDPMSMNPEAEEILDQEWLKLARAQRLAAEAPPLRQSA